MVAMRIYRPGKTAMQSGRGNTRRWVAEYVPQDRKQPDPLMGWNGSRDTRSQVRMHFDSKEAAIAFAEKHGYDYEIHDAPETKPPVPKTYSDNFRFDRIEG